MVGSDYIWKLSLWRRAVEVLELIGGYYVDLRIILVWFATPVWHQVHADCFVRADAGPPWVQHQVIWSAPVTCIMQVTGAGSPDHDTIVLIVLPVLILIIVLVCLRKVSPSWKMRFEIILTFNAAKIGWVGLHACLLLNSEIDSLGPRNMAFWCILPPKAARMCGSWRERVGDAQWDWTVLSVDPLHETPLEVATFLTPEVQRRPLPLTYSSLMRFGWEAASQMINESWFDIVVS